MASQGPASMQMLPPPEDRLYSNFEELHADLKKWTLAQGYALSIDSSSNRDATGIYRRYNLSCIRGGKVYKATSTGQRNTVSKKTGCLMKVKATKQDGWPWNGRWRITVMCADHNHPPFNPDIPNDVPPAFRHIEGEGLRWLLIMHREAKLNLRQLTIGLRTTFGDKYRFVKKSDVSNTLSKVKREEEKELAKRPPGAPPVPPGAMTAFMAALLNPVPDPYQNGVPYELVPQGWPAGPSHQPNQQQQQQPPPPQQAQQPQIGYMPPQSYPQQYVQPQQGQVAPQPYLQPHQQQQFVPQPHVPHQQQQFVPMTQPIQPPPQQMFIPQQYVPPQPGAQTKAQRNKNQAQPMPQGQNTPLQQPTEMPQPTGVPQATQAQHPTGPNPVQQQAQPSPTQWKNYTPGPNNAPPQQQPQTQQQQYNSPYQSPQVPQQPQPQPQQQQQQPYQQIPQQQQPPSQQPPQITGQRTSGHPGPGDRVQLAAGQPSLYQPTTLQATPVPGVPGAVVMEKAFSDVSDDESEVEQGEEDGEGEQGEEDGEGEQREEDGEGDSD